MFIWDGPTRSEYDTGDFLSFVQPTVLSFWMILLLLRQRTDVTSHAGRAHGGETKGEMK